MFLNFYLILESSVVNIYYFFKLKYLSISEMWENLKHH